MRISAVKYRYRERNMSSEIATSLFFIGVIAFSIVLAVAANRKMAKDKATVEAKIEDKEKEEVLAREQAAPIKSQAEAQAEAEAKAGEQRARARAAIQARIETLTKAGREEGHSRKDDDQAGCSLGQTPPVADKAGSSPQDAQSPVEVYRHAYRLNRDPFLIPMRLSSLEARLSNRLT
jgi:hypothetical protein